MYRVDFANFEELYQKYAQDLHEQVESIFLDKKRGFAVTGVPQGYWKWTARTPCTVVSLFEQGCIEKGLSYFEGGPVYNLNSPHIGGLADTVNSLYAIKKLVFDEKKRTLSELMNILKNNWEGEEILRQYVLNRYVYYGNDNDEVDEIAARLLSDFADSCISFDGKCGYRFPGGVSTFGRQIQWLPQRTATVFGAKKGDILSGNDSPTPSTDSAGATAIIRSHCKADLVRQSCGAARQGYSAPAR